MNDTNNTLIELLTETVKAFIRFPDDLKVQSTQPTSRSLTISFQPHAHDMGKLIGESGTMVKALREVGRHMGKACGTRVKVEVLEPVVGERLRPDVFRDDPNYVLDADLHRLERLGQFIFTDSAKVQYLSDNGELTTLVLLVDMRKFEYEEELVEALDVIWRATGQAHGHKLAVEMDTL